MNNKKSDVPTKQESGISDLISMMLSNLHWLVISAVVFAAITYLVTNYVISPKYQSKVVLYVYNSSANTQTVGNSDLQAAESLAETYRVIMKSNAIQDAIVGYLEKDNIVLSPIQLGSMVEVSVVNDTQLLEVTAISNDPQLAFEIAQAYAMVAPDKLTELTNAGGVSVIDNARYSNRQISPRPVRDAAYAFVIGLVLCALVLVFNMYSDRKIYTLEDLNSVTSAIVLGEIPQILTAGLKDCPYTVEKKWMLNYETEKKQDNQ